jgi:tetratricopeptide (TPR) repeat protein
MCDSTVVRCARHINAWLHFAISLLGCILFLSLVVQTQSSPDPKPLTPAQKAGKEGLALVKAKRLDEAIQRFEDGLKSDPRNLVLLNAIGAAFSLKGDSEAARSYFQSCLAIDPRFTPARKNLAIGYFTSGEYELAIPELNKLADEPGDSRRTAKLLRGIIAEKQKDYAKSVSELTSAGELLYQYPDAVLSLAQSYSELQQRGKAVSVLSHLNGLAGVTSSQYFSAGILFSQLGKSREALAEFDKVKEISEFPRLAYQRASALNELGRFQESQKILEASTKENPDVDSLRLLARVAEQNHQSTVALMALRLAAKMEPENEENYLDFSTLCGDHGNYALALQAADIGLSHLPNSYRLQVQKGAVLDNLNRFDEAQEVLRHASELQQENGAALLSLGIVQAHAGKLEDAVATLEATIRKDPANYYPHYFLGNVFMQINQENNTESDWKGEAEDAYKESIRLNPSFADAYFRIAELYLEKDSRVAEQNLVECLKKDPNHASAAYVLAQLYRRTGRPIEAQKMLQRSKRLKKGAGQQEENAPQINIAR